MFATALHFAFKIQGWLHAVYKFSILISQKLKNLNLGPRILGWTLCLIGHN